MRKALCCWIGGQKSKASAAKSTSAYSASDKKSTTHEQHELPGDRCLKDQPAVGESENAETELRSFALVFSLFGDDSSNSSSSSRLDSPPRVASRLFRQWGFLTHNFYNPKGLDEILGEIQAVSSIDHSHTNSLAIVLLVQRLPDKTAGDGEMVDNDHGILSTDSVVKQIAANPSALLQPLIHSSSLNRKPKLLLIFQHDTNNIGANISPALLPMDSISSRLSSVENFVAFYAYMPETRSRICGCTQMLAALESESASCGEQLNLLACLKRAARNVSLQRRQDGITEATMLTSFFCTLTEDLMFGK